VNPTGFSHPAVSGPFHTPSSQRTNEIRYGFRNRAGGAGLPCCHHAGETSCRYFAVKLLQIPCSKLLFEGRSATNQRHFFALKNHYTHRPPHLRPFTCTTSTCCPSLYASNRPSERHENAHHVDLSQKRLIGHGNLILEFLIGARCG
jgi:hypothetical protein